MNFVMVNESSMCRYGMVDVYLAHLRKTLGGPQTPPSVHMAVLRCFHNDRDYRSMLSCMQRRLKLTLTISTEMHLDEHPGCPAWIILDHPVPMYGTSEFTDSHATLHLRKKMIDPAPCETIIHLLSHELSHIVLFSTDNRLQRSEVAVDLTAMLLGYRGNRASSWSEYHTITRWNKLLRYLRLPYKTMRNLIGSLSPEETEYAVSAIEEMLSAEKTRA